MLPFPNPIAQAIFQEGVAAAHANALNPTVTLPTMFPKLQTSVYRIFGHPTSEYNCIAWSLGRRDVFCWPNQPGLSYWPTEIPDNDSLDAFNQLFQSIGYSECINPGFDRRLEKVAIYEKGGHVTHASRQRANGRWSSKAGHWWLFEHDFDAVSGHAAQEYGNIVRLMSRPRPILRYLKFRCYELFSSDSE